MRENTDQKNSEYGHFSRSGPQKIRQIRLVKKEFINLIELIEMTSCDYLNSSVNSSIAVKSRCK